MITIKYGISANLPYKADKDIIENYLKIFKENEEYDAYSIDDNLKIVKGKGSIKNNGSWNHHNNYDDSKNELYFKEQNEIGNPMSRNVQIAKWWTVSWEEIKGMQITLASKCKTELEKVSQHINEMEQQKRL
jgi:hypothetical protein